MWSVGRYATITREGIRAVRYNMGLDSSVIFSFFSTQAYIFGAKASEGIQRTSLCTIRFRKVHLFLSQKC